MKAEYVKPFQNVVTMAIAVDSNRLAKQKQGLVMAGGNQIPGH